MENTQNYMMSMEESLLSIKKIKNDEHHFILWDEFIEEAKRLGYIAAPMMAVNLSLFLINVVSMMMVGHLGELALSSSAIAVSLSSVTGFSVLASPSWLYVAPEGFETALIYVKNEYGNPIIYITENGIGDPVGLSPSDALKDIWRISYHTLHLWKLLRAICDHKVRVKGYFAWSFIDNFEWTNGYTVRMGFYATDTKLIRTPKWSVNWFERDS
ncbi:beta-glucosidase 13-like [Mercurialis annua]|uniref:beta-glucosidase 13-like n=1 Tax=Mercurialis annua TaxID=3986 RepID=UPI0024AC88F5|nr:beta-glucosidase 13-like [Mercurialis annua]